MEDTFVVDIANDKGFSIILKREANIILASLDKNSNEYLYKKERFEETLSVIKALENTEPQHDDDINFILNTINRIWNIGILSPLTLKEDEFLDYPDKAERYHNKRYLYIYKTLEDNKIYNGHAFNIAVRAVYKHDTKEQILVNKIPVQLDGNKRVYISKGGVITGEYIENCIIRQDVVNKHAFTVQSIVCIPVCTIFDGDNEIYVVDHREPKLKALQQFYEVPVLKDKAITNKHYNLRKYTKLK